MAPSSSLKKEKERPLFGGTALFLYQDKARGRGPLDPITRRSLPNRHKPPNLNFMWKPLHPIYNLWRRYFGGYSLDDPRPIQAEAPYTYYLPSVVRLNSTQIGDHVQLLFRSEPYGLKYGVERMWVEVTSVSGEELTGSLLNQPFDMPQLKPGAQIQFKQFHMIDITSERELPLDEPKQKQYWDRCMVDRCVVDEGIPVYYLYREEPDLAAPDDKDPDSGWRIRGDYRNVSDEDFEARKAAYIALGKVLNADDSWIHLIDSPIGSAFMRNFETGEYEIYEREPQDDVD